MIRVLCTALNAESGPHFQILANAGHECHVVDRSLDLWNPAVLSRAIRDYDAVIAGSEPWPPDVIASSSRLRVIARAGVGFDAVNLAACDERRIVVATTPGCNHHSVAEHAIAMLMAVGRGFPALDQEVRRGEWNRNPWPRVWGRTIGLVGLGRIGQATAIRERTGVECAGLRSRASYRFRSRTRCAACATGNTHRAVRLHLAAPARHTDNSAHDQRRQHFQDEAGRGDYQHIPRTTH